MSESVSIEASSPEHSRLRWRCRRGMRELDVLLTSWLDTSFADAKSDHRLAFEQLLACEDDAIWDWMMGRVNPPAALRSLVIAISEHHADQRDRG